MAKRKFGLTEQQRKELQRAFSQCKAGTTRIRYQAVRLYGSGYSVAQIMEITGINRTSLMEWCRKYSQKGIAGLEDHRGGRHRARLTLDQIAEIGDKLREYTPHDLLGTQTHMVSGQHWTVEDLAQFIKRRYEISWRTRGSYQMLFTQCGFSYQRGEKVYRSRRQKDVSEFEELVEKK